MSVVSTMKRHWHELQRGKPGERFQERYERAQESRCGWGMRVAKIVGGVLAIAIGLVEIVFPGPAVVFIFLGGALLATESKLIARAMDWLEVKCRAVWSWLQRKWRHATSAGRGAAVSVLAAGGLAAGIVAYRVISE